jgi:hypothetical protein
MGLDASTTQAARNNPPPAPRSDPPPAAASGATANPPASAKPVTPGVNLGPPLQLAPVAKEKEDDRYLQWLDHELAGLPQDKADRIRKAIDEIRKAESFAATDDALQQWLNQPGHEALYAVYKDYRNPITVAVKLGPAPLDPIETWLFTGDHLNPKSIVAALQGDKFRDDDKRRLLDLALANFSHLAFDKIDELALIVRDPRIDPSVRRLVAERLLQRAVDPGDAAENPRAQARAFALDFVLAMRDDPRGRAELLALRPPQDGFRLARALGQQPLPDTRLATSRSGGDDHRLAEHDPRLNDQMLLSDARDQILAGLQTLAGTPAAGSPAITALVYGLADEITPLEITANEISPGNLHPAPRLAHSLAVALAYQWDPKNPPVKRLEELLTSPSGASLLCTGSPDWKDAARKTVRLNPQITAATLERQGGDPRRNPEVAAAVTKLLMATAHGGRVTVPTAEEDANEKAGAKLVTDALRTPSGHELLFGKASAADRREALLIMLADHGQKLTRADFEHTSDAWQLEGIAGPFAAQKLANVKAGDLSSLSAIGRTNLIGLWLGKDPTADIRLTEQDIEAAQQALARGEIPPYLNEKDFFPDNEDVRKFAGTDRLVVEQAILFSDRPVPVPLLHGYKLDGTEFYIDQDGNVQSDSFPQDKNYRVSYRTAFQNFLDENPLPEGTLYFQGQGFKTPGHRETPAARDTSKKVAHGVARGLTAAAFIASLVLTDGFSATMLINAGYLGMGYLAYEDASHLDWLDAHGHDINPFTNPDQAVLSTWLDMGADTLPPVAAAGGAVSRSLVTAGLLRAEKAVLVTAALERTAKAANLAALGHQFGVMLRNGNVTAENCLEAGVSAWLILRHAPQRPAAETPHPPVTPTTPPSALPTARVVPAAARPTAATPSYKLNGPVTPKPVAPPSGKRPAGGPPPFAFDGTATWPGTSPNASLPVPPVPAGLPPGAGREPPGGASPAVNAGVVPVNPSRPPAGNRSIPPLDPNTRHMAGKKGGNPSEEPTEPPIGRTMEADEPPADEQQAWQPPTEPIAAATPPAGDGGTSVTRELERLQKKIDKLERDVLAEPKPANPDPTEAIRDYRIASAERERAQRAYDEATPEQRARIGNELGAAREKAEQAHNKLKQALLTEHPTHYDRAINPVLSSKRGPREQLGDAIEDYEIALAAREREQRAYDNATPEQRAKIRYEAARGAREAAEQAYNEARHGRQRPATLRPPRDAKLAERALRDAKMAEAEAWLKLQDLRKLAAKTRPEAASQGDSGASPPATVSQGVPQWVLTAEKSPGGLSGKIAELQQEIAGREKALKQLKNQLRPRESEGLLRQLAGARRDLAAAQKRRSDLIAEAKPLRWEYLGILRSRRMSVDSNLPMAKRLAAANNYDVHRVELEELEKQWNELGDKIFGPDTPGRAPEHPGGPDSSPQVSRSPADTATALQVDSKAQLERLKKQLDDAESRTVVLGIQAEAAEAELGRAVDRRDQEAPRNHGVDSQPTPEQAAKALTDLRAAEAAEKRARAIARELRAQYDAAKNPAIAARTPPGPPPAEGGAAPPPAAESPKTSEVTPRVDPMAIKRFTRPPPVSPPGAQVPSARSTPPEAAPAHVDPNTQRPAGPTGNNDGSTKGRDLRALRPPMPESLRGTLPPEVVAEMDAMIRDWNARTEAREVKRAQRRGPTDIDLARGRRLAEQAMNAAKDPRSSGDERQNALESILDFFDEVNLGDDHAPKAHRDLAKK